VSTLGPGAEGFRFTTALELGACCDRRKAQAQDDRGCEYARIATSQSVLQTCSDALISADKEAFLSEGRQQCFFTRGPDAAITICRPVCRPLLGLSLLKVELDLSDKLLPVQPQHRRKHDFARSGCGSTNSVKTDYL